MSRGPAATTSDRTSSVAGFTVLNGVPSTESTICPSMNSPWDGAMSTIDRDSGAGAYSNGMEPSVDRELVGVGVATGGQLLALHEQVVEQGRRPEPEPVGRQPVVAHGLVDDDQVANGVLGGPDAARRLHAHLATGDQPEVSDRLEHDQRHRQRRGRR